MVDTRETTADTFSAAAVKVRARICVLSMTVPMFGGFLPGQDDWARVERAWRVAIRNRRQGYRPQIESYASAPSLPCLWLAGAGPLSLPIRSSSSPINPPRGKLRGGFTAWMNVYFSVRSRTLPQASENALSIAVQARISAPRAIHQVGRPGPKHGRLTALTTVR